jgi:MarR family transcriptional regulator, 2-MHQ and catechol-resistance regulon repressor
MEAPSERVFPDRRPGRIARANVMDESCSDARDAVMGIMMAASWLSAQVSSAVSRHGITPSQYNVLRVLKESHPEPMTCTAIGCRLFDKTPDVTRLLNRLEKSGCIGRSRCSEDRRIVEVHITPVGTDIVESLEPEMTIFDEELTSRMSSDDFRKLTCLLSAIRRPSR